MVLLSVLVVLGYLAIYVFSRSNITTLSLLIVWTIVVFPFVGTGVMLKLNLDFGSAFLATLSILGALGLAVWDFSIVRFNRNDKRGKHGKYA